MSRESKHWRWLLTAAQIAAVAGPLLAISRCGEPESASGRVGPTSPLSDLALWDRATSAERQAATATLRATLVEAGFKDNGLRPVSVGETRREVSSWTHTPTGMEFVLVPGGRFLMGTPPEERWNARFDETVHQVTISSPFLIATTEVTQAVWQRVMGSNPSKPRGELLPANKVTWHEARAFCSEVGLHLPTEAQFEFFCRAGTATRFWFGDDYNLLVDNEWCYLNANRSIQSVAKKMPNGLGLFDVQGNVSEWCLDSMADYGQRPVVDPLVSSASGLRAARGSSWRMARWSACSSSRQFREEDKRYLDVGLRPAFQLLKYRVR